MIKKKKPAYSLFSNLKFVFGNMWKSGKLSTVFVFLRSPFVVASAFLGIYLSTEVVGAVTEGKAPVEVITVIGVISLALLASLLMEKYLSAHLEPYMQMFDFKSQVNNIKKIISSDYANIESAEGITRASKAMEHSGSDTSASRQVAGAMSSLTANIIGAVFYAVMVIKLSPWILLAVSVTTLFGFICLKKTASWRYRNKDKWQIYVRKLDYLRSNSGDFTRAKDMRLYNMSDWFKGVFSDTVAKRMGWNKKEQSYGMGMDSLRAVLSFIREGIAYGFLIFLIFDRSMSVADFVLYFGVVSGFSVWLDGMVADLDKLYGLHLNFCEVREFLDYPNTFNTGPGAALPNDTFSIEFKHVGFRYQGCDEDTIKDLSFTIHKGEKLAIVGLNGAGKTTLVKLICGLYDPTAGEILINGKPVNAYNRKEYYTLFSAVFQEMFITPMTIARNVSTANEEATDKTLAGKALELAGLSAKLEGLPNGMETRLVKSVYADAVDLSGGEQQKLALARALYKSGKALILDEPTAALDPIAESNIYMEYNRMAAGRTSIFISHRLASTRFCDRIFFIENGGIAECGSHDELMKKKGKYSEMFEIQSHYYKEGDADNDCA